MLFACLVEKGYDLDVPAGQYESPKGQLKSVLTSLAILQARMRAEGYEGEPSARQGKTACAADRGRRSDFTYYSMDGEDHLCCYCGNPRMLHLRYDDLSKEKVHLLKQGGMIPADFIKKKKGEK